MAIETLRPNGAGDYTNIPLQDPSSNFHWDKVDEVVSDGNGAGRTIVFISSDATQKKDAYTLQDTSIPSGSIINSITVWAKWFDYIDSWMQPFLRLGSSETTGTEAYYTGGFGAVERTTSELLARPGGDSWAVSDLNSLQVAIGIRCGSGSYCVVTQIYVVVDYTPPPQTIAPSSISQPVAIGTPTVLTSALIIHPSSIVQVVAIGTPSLHYPQTISPPSIILPVVVGTPWVGILGIIMPQSIIQQISIGSPTLLKYVWHVILDGQYSIETPEVNRAYIIGRDQYGNPVYGTAVNTDEVALVGERLDFQPDPAIPTTAQAADVASAVLSKMRLMGKRGVIFIPPNCGQELFDVVQVSDLGANQSAVKFRVVGLRFEYNAGKALYRHRLILGAP